MLDFNKYLKLCRQNLHFTQWDLVTELFEFDPVFRGLDVNTLGRWERAVTKTPVSKQVKILEYFFEKFDFYFPFLEMNDIKSIEKQFSLKAVNKILGKHKFLVMNFPTTQSDSDDFRILHAKESSYQNLAFSTAINICDDMYGENRFYSQERLAEFAQFPSTFFLICEYKEQYFGHFLFVYLRPDIYDKIVNFEMEYFDITTEDLAGENEKGSYMNVGLFAMNEKAISLLFVRFYAHLIINQKKILNVCTLISNNDAVNIATNFGLKKGLVRDDLMVHNGTIKDLLLTEQIVKILFSPNSAIQ